MQPGRPVSSPINVNRNMGRTSPASLLNYTASSDVYSVVNRLQFQNSNIQRSTSAIPFTSLSSLSMNNDNNRIVIFVY